MQATNTQTEQAETAPIEPAAAFARYVVISARKRPEVLGAMDRVVQRRRRRAAKARL